MKRFYLPCWKKQYQASAGTIYACSVTDNTSERVCEEVGGHLHNHVGLTENFDQSENEEFLVNDSP